ncbi:MAG TPA: OmpA family protein, partial [bacterium]|nr:OmpA family protein [bacterium]
SLTPEAKAALDWIAQDIAQREGLVIVEGHADHFNTDEYNLRLGYRRALNVADYLKSAGVWDERLVIRSFGEARPVATNWIDSERAKNRQVVIKMFAQGDGMSSKEAMRAYQKTLQEKKSTESRAGGINFIMSGAN